MSESDAKVLTFLHISDIHFEPDNKDQKMVLSKLLNLIQDISEGKWNSLSEVFKGRLCLDFIFCTGDIAYSGKPSEYKLAKEFFDDLLEITGLKKEQLFFVPGNHDVDWDRLPDLEISIESDKDADEFFSSEDKLRKFIEPFHGYQEFTRHYFPERQFDEYRCYYTAILNIRGVSVGVAGLNSAWPLRKWGEEVEKKEFQLLGKRPLEDALKSISEADLKIVLFHHPIHWLADVEENVIKMLLGKYANLVLTGHQIKPSVEVDIKPQSEIKIWVGQRKVLTIQAAPTYKKSVPNRVQIGKIQIWGNHKHVFLYPLTFNEETKRWVLDTSVYPDEGYIRKIDIGEKEFPYWLKERTVPKQIIPFENKVVKKGVWTELERPSREDFQKGRVAFRENIVEKVLKELERKSFCVIEGPRDCGKTWLCYAIGFKLKRRKIPSYFVEVDEDFDANEIWKFIKGFDKKEDIVWFIEDCHNNIEGVRDLYMLLQSELGNLRFIFTTRKISVLNIFGRSREKRSEVCFEVSLGKSEVETVEHVKQIIRKFIRTEDIKTDVTEEEIDYVSRKWGNDLKGVYLRLVAWKSKLESGVHMRLTEVEDKCVYDYIWDPNEKIQLGRRQRLEVLLPISVICQFEPLSVFMLFFKTTAQEIAFKLENKGLLDRVEWAGREFFRMPEGRADWILRTLSYKISPKFVDIETKRVFKEYLKSKPPNWTYVFYCLNLRQDTTQVKKILTAIFEDEDVWKTIKEMVEKELFFSLAYFPVISQAMIEHKHREKEIWSCIKNKGLNWIMSEIFLCKISALTKLLLIIKRLERELFEMTVYELNKVPQKLEKNLQEASIKSLCWLCYIVFFAYPESEWGPLSRLILKIIEDKLKSGTANNVKHNLPFLNGIHKIITLEEFFARFQVSNWKQIVSNSPTFDSIYHLLCDVSKKWKLESAAKNLGKALIEIGTEFLIMRKEASAYRLYGAVKRIRELGLDIRPLVEGVIESDVNTLRQLFLIQKSRQEKLMHGEPKGAFLFGLNGIWEIAKEIHLHRCLLIENISNFTEAELKELFCNYCDEKVINFFLSKTATHDPLSCLRIIEKVGGDTWAHIITSALLNYRRMNEAFWLLWNIYRYDKTLAKQLAQETKGEFFDGIMTMQFPKWSLPLLGLMHHCEISIQEILEKISHEKALQIIEEYRNQSINTESPPTTEILLSLIALKCKLPENEFNQLKKQIINETRVKEKIQSPKVDAQLKGVLQEILEIYKF